MSKLRFLADESCDFGVVRALRAALHDVQAIVERAKRAPDDEVMALAETEGRILLTEDKDFGWLAFVKGARAGVILVRWPGGARAILPGVVVDLIEQHAQSLGAAFTVVEPGRIRMTRLPGDG
jgi:predicted nuclease of predicted toxin-antitoxin system